MAISLGPGLGDAMVAPAIPGNWRTQQSPSTSIRTSMIATDHADSKSSTRLREDVEPIRKMSFAVSSNFWSKTS